MSLIKRFAFWLSVLSILICLGDYAGSEAANIVLIRFNPVIDALIFREPFTKWMINRNITEWAAGSLLISLSVPAYLIHFASFLMTGFLIDFLIKIFPRRRTGSFV
jgi:hypothetical protein